MHAFRAPGSGKREKFSFSRPQVRGGRWKIRRVPTVPHNKPWRAWTEGKAKKWNRRFATHEEAYAWAQLVAITYRDNEDQIADAALGLALRYGWEGQDVEYLDPDTQTARVVVEDAARAYTSGS